jgi:hypothetical protein
MEIGLVLEKILGGTHSHTDPTTWFSHEPFLLFGIMAID